MTVLDEIEVSLEQYFENLEFICEGYTWQSKLPLDVLLNQFKEFGAKIKSYHSLYPDSKIRDTPGNQLFNFIGSINTFLTQTQEYFTIHLLDALNTIDNQLFSILTSDQKSDELLRIFEKINLPQIDLNFTRFFYSQILPRWVSEDANYFNIFMSDVQKINELVPLLKKLFSNETLTSLRQNKGSEFQQKISSVADKLEKQGLILPASLSEKIKLILIDYLTFAHKYPDIIQLQFHLENINKDLLNKDLLFTNNFSHSCQEQIELIRTIKKKIDLDPDFFQRYNIDETVYNTKITEIEQMIFSHNNILEQIAQIEIVDQITIDILIKDEFRLIDLLKNNLHFFVSDFKKIFLLYIENMLYLIDWWNNLKKSLLQHSQLFQLMFENVPEDEKVRVIKEIKNKYFKNLFKDKKFFFSFIEEVVGDLLPIFDHFQVIHKSVFNSFEDLSKWDSLEKTEPIKNGKSILEAIIQFFNRWNETGIQQSFETKLTIYNTDFVPFYQTFSEINQIYKELTEKRFSKPDQAVQKVDLILSKLKDSERTIYNLFSSNLELINDLEKLSNEILTLKVLILNFDRLDEEIIILLVEKFDSVSIKPFLKLMRENLSKFPASQEKISNKEKLKVLSLYNFMILLTNIDEYFNDSMISTITNIEVFNDLSKSVLSTKTVLMNLHSLLSPSKKSKGDQFASNIKTFVEIIAPEWLKIGKKTNTFLLNQSKKMSLGDRKTMVTQLTDYKPPANLFSFKWSIFEKHIETFSKQFFPTFILFFKQLLTLEEHWQTLILKPPTKNIGEVKKDLIKEVEKLTMMQPSQDTTSDFLINTKELLDRRITCLKNSDKDYFPSEQMKTLIL